MKHEECGYTTECDPCDFCCASAPHGTEEIGLL